MENQSTSNNSGNLNDKVHCTEPENESPSDNMCTVCFDTWTESGDHMATRLKCGHTFGYNCICRWLSGIPCCPLCRKTNETRHMRGVYHPLNNRYDNDATRAHEEYKRNLRRLRQARRRTIFRANRRINATRLAADENLNESAASEQS